MTPRASRDEIVGEREDTVLARVTAPAHGGRANEALRRLIAARARVGISRVEIVSGGRSRVKRVRVEGISALELREALGLGHQRSQSGER